MKVVILTWEEFVPDCPADLEVTSPEYLGVFEESDTAGIENAKLAFADDRVRVDDGAYEDKEQLPENPTIEQFLTSDYGGLGYFQVYGPLELGQVRNVYTGGSWSPPIGLVQIDDIFKYQQLQEGA